MSATRDTTPILLAGTTPALTVGAAGAAVQIPAGTLANPFNVPLEVRGLYLLQTAFVPNVIGPAGIGDVALRAGRHDLTNGFCPVVALSPAYNSIGETWVTLVGGAPPTFNASCHTRWIFDRPMILLPGAAVTGAFRVNPALAEAVTMAGSTLSLTVVVHARRLAAGAPTPRSGPIPFASGAWYVAVNTPIANDLQLMNTLPIPLTVTKLIAMGLDLAQVATGLTITGPGGMLGTPRRTVLEGDANSNFAQCHSVEEAHTLNPGESYKAVIDVLNGAETAISMIGYRTEAL
jgi:hypothetical protein